ncbi:Pheromone-binding protein-related protein 1 [Habropoda laboriosa]|uniref:Pheromone-binding protein-related protein 1 n=1 Tax=Habropoda laboriosa TaxID=597456 RepID=A0A0L7RIJ1_9HYME|nr:Pheromone-binding protein-related protein 1 [Habropoda laboriosa]
MIATAASVVNACQTQTGVATVDIEAVRNGTWPQTQELKCYMYCLWEQFGLVDDKRELSLSGMLTFFQRIPAYRAEVLKAISECKGIGKYFAKGDNCEYAYTFNKCYAFSSPRVSSKFIQRIRGPSFSIFNSPFPLPDLLSLLIQFHVNRRRRGEQSSKKNYTPFSLCHVMESYLYERRRLSLYEALIKGNIRQALIALTFYFRLTVPCASPILIRQFRSHACSE